VALISAEVGMPRKLGAGLLVQGAVTKVAAYTEESQRYAWEEPGDVATVVRQTVGVVAAITPSNVPLGIALDKVVPALLAGCTKPSEVAPRNAWALAEASHEAGLPPGVCNLVSGRATNCPSPGDRSRAKRRPANPSRTDHFARGDQL
jgi:aldehyde dehydrogenase (NAD+)